MGKISASQSLSRYNHLREREAGGTRRSRRGAVGCTYTPQYRRRRSYSVYHLRGAVIARWWTRRHHTRHPTVVVIACLAPHRFSRHQESGAGSLVLRHANMIIQGRSTTANEVRFSSASAVPTKEGRRGRRTEEEEEEFRHFCLCGKGLECRRHRVTHLSWGRRGQDGRKGRRPPFRCPTLAHYLLCRLVLPRPPATAVIACDAR